ncbi:hypothetical protein [Marinimicrobium locisalis]|uniref:hypothetical protein n=1 Tax=Marinimicrobium locisalis TaxID=546022 RepID=UPI0032214CD2
MKSHAYLNFLDKAAEGEIKAVSQIQHAGKLLERSITDGELQEVEDAISQIPENLNTQLLVDLNAEFNLLRVAGSQKVRKTIDDLYYVLAHRYRTLELADYPIKVQKIFVGMHPNINNIRRGQLSAEGWELRNTLARLGESDHEYIELKVSDEERFSIVLAAAIFEHLLDLVVAELDAGPRNT